MSTHQNYLPILRWKAAEKGALKKLDSVTRKAITPVIELVMPQPKMAKGDELEKTPSELLEESVEAFLGKLDDLPKEILSNWGQQMILLDVQLIDGSIRAKALQTILAGSDKLDIFMVPVVNIIPIIGSNSDSQTRRVVVEFYHKIGNGLCLRLSESDLKEESIEKTIVEFIEKNNLNEEKVDLIVDLKEVDQTTSVASLARLLNRIPNLEKWRTFAVAAGSFPQDLSEFEKHNQYDIPRTDWKTWQQIRDQLRRQPAFADYTIQYPFYRTPNGAANPSASIRYALEESWLVMRGEGLRNPKGAGFKQYPAQAQLLAAQDFFKGPEFSFGDAYIAEKAKDINTKQTGNPKTWLEAGINHHLTLVANQIANLS